MQDMQMGWACSEGLVVVHPAHPLELSQMGADCVKSKIPSPALSNLPGKAEVSSTALQHY